MENPIRRADQILAYRSLQQVLGGKTRNLWSVGPSDSAMKARSDTTPTIFPRSKTTRKAVFLSAMTCSDIRPTVSYVPSLATP
jgi:hypothetical protein